MSGMLFLACLALLGASALGRNFEIVNKCDFTVWVGAQGNDKQPALENGGFVLDAGASRNVDVPDGYGGRFWGRTGCSGDTGHCETGDCGSGVECNGAGGAPPVTLAEFTLNGHEGLDFYDVSLVDGYNIAVTMVSTRAGDSGGGEAGGKYSCAPTTCTYDINSQCPEELKQTLDGRVVACNSACNKFNTDDYCCRGAHDKPETCRSTDWAVDYPAGTKAICPDAYSYAYDDHKSTYTCSETDYQVIFCP